MAAQLFHLSFVTASVFVHYRCGFTASVGRLPLPQQITGTS
jgi:hypothetical protein